MHSIFERGATGHCMGNDATWADVHDVESGMEMWLNDGGTHRCLRRRRSLLTSNGPLEPSSHQKIERTKINSFLLFDRSFLGLGMIYSLWRKRGIFSKARCARKNTDKTNVANKREPYLCSSLPCVPKRFVVLFWSSQNGASLGPKRCHLELCSSAKSMLLYCKDASVLVQSRCCSTAKSQVT